MSYYHDEKEPIPIIREPDDEEILEIKSNVNENDDIWKDNYTLCTQLEELLDITEIIPVFRDPRSKLAQSFANAMQANSKELLSAQCTLRQCFQSVMKVKSYKPAAFDNNEQKANWDTIHKFDASIRDGIINVTDATAKWFALILELDYGLAYFYRTIASMHGEPDMAILQFQQAAEKVVKFQQLHSDAFGLIREQSMQAMREIESKFFSGNQSITNAQKKLDKHRQQHAKEVERLKQIEYDRLKEISPIDKEIIELQGTLPQYDIQIKYTNKKITNLDKELKQAADRARTNDRDAEDASNYRKELWSKKSWFGWNTYDFYKDVHTGEKDRLHGIADRYRNLRKQASSTKDVNIQIKQFAVKDKTAAEQQIKAKKREKDTMVSIYNNKINFQRDQIKAAKKKCQGDKKTIEDAIKRYAVREHSVAAFLNATHQLSQEPLKALEATKKIAECIEALAEIVAAQCRTVWTIAEYFKKIVKLPEELSIAFKENGLTLMTHLICTKEEFEDDVWCIIEDIVKHKENANLMKRLIRNICTDEDTIKKWKRQQESITKSNIEKLVEQIPALSIFFPSLHRRLKFAWKMLPLEKAAGNKALLSILPGEIRSMKDKDAKNRKMITIPDNVSQFKAIGFSKDGIKEDIKHDKNDKDEEIRKLKEQLKQQQMQNEIDKLKAKLNNQKPKKRTKHSKKKPKYYSSSEESSSDNSSSDESTSEDSSEDSEEERRHKKKKSGKKDKKNIKRNKYKKKKRRKKKYDTSTEEENDSESEERRKRVRKKDKMKSKKHTKKNEECDSDNDNDKGSKIKGMLKKETLTLDRLYDDAARCVDNDFNKVTVYFDETKWHKKLKGLEEEGNKKRSDVKLIVSSIDTGSRVQYTIIDAKLDDESSD